MRADPGKFYGGVSHSQGLPHPRGPKRTYSAYRCSIDTTTNGSSYYDDDVMTLSSRGLKNLHKSASCPGCLVLHRMMLTEGKHTAVPSRYTPNCVNITHY
ncbi:hypothetical protein RRG08_050833 [Elysia crispata]|uniref:Uncharacterized protein n=1 Tax=Elysia crispata TaxID=231223 RepID=A0AAE1ADG7_9GAST|nr:hypothetical protein RRG08_050833 [Elysia crispata]